MRSSRHAEERGAALIVAIAVMTILLAISLTFFTVSRLELKTATNVENSVKAELLANAATNIAISFLNHDLLIHPTFTSIDHAWRTYFNGAWVAGKDWAFPSGVPWMRDPTGYVDILYGDPALWPVDTGDEGLIGHVYVPRKEGLPIDDPGDYDDELYPFVIDPGLDTHQFTAAQINAWADVDNDQDGYSDSMWIPLVADTFHGNVMLVSDDPSIGSELIELGDRIDNDLDLELYEFLPDDYDPTLRKILGEDSIEEINETAPFLYYGGSDGLDNDGDGEIDEDDERWAAAMGLDIPRFFLTAPLNAADGTYLVLQNVPILDAASEVFRYVNIDCSPDGGWVDEIDNDFDLITNKHTEYYTRADGNSVSDPENRILPVDEFNRLRGVYEISPRYLADKDWRIKATGEPVCELVGRAAILVTDEASKVNLNAAGGHSVDVAAVADAVGSGEYYLDDLPDLLDVAGGRGAGTWEYATLALPQVGDVRSRKLWNLLTGAPNGSMALGPLTDAQVLDANEDVPEIEDIEYIADASLPGYGFVDDNGNALMLAMNGLDDDGDGLIDEGISLGPDPANPDPEYVRRLGHFEGIDEPGELRRRRPYRNQVAEGSQPMYDDVRDLADNDLDGVANEIGELGDRTLRTGQEIKRVVRDRDETYPDPEVPNRRLRLPATFEFFERMQNLITLHSVDLGTRYIEAKPDPAALAVPAYPLEKQAQGLKLDYNYARADEIAEALEQDWALHSLLFAESETSRFLYGLLQEGVDVRNTPMLAEPFYADPKLRALQLAANVRDLCDADFARTELTMQVEDEWWTHMQVNAEAPFTAVAEEDAEHRPIEYTVSGFEGLRITEMMVRPVRRVEAEMSLMDIGVHLYFNPNVIDVFPNQPGFTAAASVFQRSMQDKINEIGGDYAIAGPLPPGGQYWKYPYPGNPQNESEGFLGSTAAMVTDYITEYDSDPDDGVPGIPMNGIPVPLQIDPEPAPPTLGSWPNIMEFVFGPGPGLPPGRYYLTINTTNWEGMPTVTASGHLLFATKYVRASVTNMLPLTIRPGIDPGVPPITVAPNGQTILDDVAAFCMDNYDPGNPRQPAQYFYYLADHPEDPQSLHFHPLNFQTVDPRSCIGREDMDDPLSPRTGWVFLPTSGYALVPWLGYDQDQAFTVTIPHYAEDPADQVYLHVAVCMGVDGPYIDPDPSDPDYVPELAINFFDFSQEPDHEWVEIENVSGRDVDVSGWELVVGGVDPAGEVVTVDTVEMRIPEGMPDDPTQPVVLGTEPPNNRLLLAVNARDYFEYYDEIGPINENLLFMNGIGLVGADLSDLPGAFNFRDVTSPAIPMRNPAFVGDDGRGGRIDAYESEDEPAYVFEDVEYQGRIVQLEELRCPHAERSLSSLDSRVSTEEADDIAFWVLRGGVFPNYPEHDGIDNDADNDVLSADGIDNDGNSAFLLYDGVDNDEDGVWDWSDPGSDPDPYEGVDDPLLGAAGDLIRVEGIDEGRFRMDYGIPVDVPGGFALNRSPSPGSFSARAVQYSSIWFNYNDWGGFYNSLDFSTFGLADYLSDSAAPPEWKEFVERRFFPGDNVVVSLFETFRLNSGVRLRRGVVDRVTYTERDVFNRAIDDVMDVRAPLGGVLRARPTLYAGMEDLSSYMTFWPDNTMGIDFYRTLERKHHPLYNGDRFGTQNRWQATDGNYDDWSHEPVMARNNAGEHIEFMDVGFRPEKWFGSPLKANAATYLHGVDPDLLDEGEEAQAALLASLEAFEVGAGAVASGSGRVVSVGDVLTMPYFSLTKAYVDNNLLGEYGFAGHDKLAYVAVNGVLVGQRNPDDRNALVGAGAIGSITLSCGQADFRLLYPPPANESDWPSLMNLLQWEEDAESKWIAPQLWSPVCLYKLGANDNDVSLGTAFKFWVGAEIEPQERTFDHFLFNPPDFPLPLDPANLLSRWPIEQRTVFYASANVEGFSQDNQFRDDGSPAAEALFVWDAADGIENGEYNLYIDTGGRLDPLLAANEFCENPPPENPPPPPYFGASLLTPLGQALCTKAETMVPSELLLDVEVFTDRSGDGKCWDDANDDGQLAWSELRRGEGGDSFGAVHGMAADWDGYAHYGVVRIENNYLAVAIRNWAPEGWLNRFAGVVLAPPDRTPGRLDVNTVVTRAYPEDDSATPQIEHRGFNALMGVPGILRDARREDPPDDIAPPEVGLTLEGEPILPLIPEGDDATDPLGRAQLVEANRPSHWDGRYYVFLSDLMADEANDLGTYPLSTLQDDAPRVEEVTWRFSQAANLLTTRSDVFEILVTVQAGYGIDVEGDPAGGADGRIDYRSSTEFIVTSEKKTRTIYER